MTRSRPMSRLGRVIARYLALKTALGRQYALERRALESLDVFLHGEGGRTADFTPERFARWTRTLHHLTPTVRRNRLRFVRNLACTAGGPSPHVSSRIRPPFPHPISLGRRTSSPPTRSRT